MNRTLRTISWAFAVAGYLVTLCFMQRENIFDSRAAALYLLGALIPFVVVAVAAQLTTAQSMATAITVGSGLIAVGGSALYYCSFAGAGDDYAGLLFIIVPALEFLFAASLLGLAIWCRKRRAL